MSTDFLTDISKTLEEIKADGLYKRERMITSPQGARSRLGMQRSSTFVPTITSAWQIIPI